MNQTEKRGAERGSDGGTSTAPAPEVSAEMFRAAVGNLATAVSIVATDGPAGRAGMTCSAVCAVSAVPPTILACVHNQSAAHAVIKANGVFAVSILSAEQGSLSQVFAGIGNVPMFDRFASGTWEVLATGAPYRADALCALDAVLLAAHEIGTHSIFVGRVVAVSDGAMMEPLIHHRRAYATTRPL